jgi:hypothetical protein
MHVIKTNGLEELLIPIKEIARKKAFNDKFK